MWCWLGLLDAMPRRPNLGEGYGAIMKFESNLKKWFSDHEETIRTALVNAPEVVTVDALQKDLYACGFSNAHQDKFIAYMGNFPNGLKITATPKS